LRYFGGAVAFGFAAVWIMWSLSAALICLLSAAAGYGAVVLAERARAALAGRAAAPRASTTPSPTHRTPEAEDLSLRADELNHDLGHVYQPTAAIPSLTAEADGAPLNDGTAATSGDTP
jgi:hypothetical protein